MVAGLGVPIFRVFTVIVPMCMVIYEILSSEDYYFELVYFSFYIVQ